MAEALQPVQLEYWLRQRLKETGFCLTGISPAVQPPHYEQFCNWLDKGMAGSMHYLPERKAAYQHPRHVLDGVQSVLMLGLSYFGGPRAPDRPGSGRIARYAWGQLDYHDWIHRQFKSLLRDLKSQFPEVQARGVVDTAPLLERDFARMAGLGWYGKNTLLINKHTGSYFLLAALLLDQVLNYDPVHQTSHCGTCTRCLDACPTQAFPEPGVLDARRCISYLTIESRDAVPLPLRSQIGDWAFGCDICQDVCPWNRHAVPTPVPEFLPLANQNPVELLPLFELTDEQFRERFRRTPMWRSKRTGLLKNAALVLGNQRHQAAIPALLGCLERESDEALVAHCLWALGEIGGPKALQSLTTYLVGPVPDNLRHEAENALQQAKQQ